MVMNLADIKDKLQNLGIHNIFMHTLFSTDYAVFTTGALLSSKGQECCIAYKLCETISHQCSLFPRLPLLNGIPLVFCLWPPLLC
jgi:hypothetical protein